MPNYRFHRDDIPVRTNDFSAPPNFCLFTFTFYLIHPAVVNAARFSAIKASSAFCGSANFLRPSDISTSSSWPKSIDAGTTVISGAAAGELISAA